MNQILWWNLYKIQGQSKLNYGDKSQNSGYLEVTFWGARKVLCFDRGGGYVSKITHNISLSYMPKIASYFMDIIIHQKLKKYV